MDRWRDKVAVVTGASSGIGAATAIDLVKAGLVVVGLARREEKMREIRDSLPKALRSKFHTITCDITNEENVKNVFIWMEHIVGGPDILVNNAEILRQTELTNPNSSKEIKEVLETNVMGVVYCTREAFNSMKARKVDGHIININCVIQDFGENGVPLNIYSTTKYSLRAMTETYRREFQQAGLSVKISTISPGMVSTNIFPLSFEERLKSEHPMLKPEDVSNAILYLIGTPTHVQVQEIIIKPMWETNQFMS